MRQPIRVLAALCGSIGLLGASSLHARPSCAVPAPAPYDKPLFALADTDTAFASALRGLTVPDLKRWIAGPSSAGAFMRLAGEPWILVSSCQSQRCDTHRIAILWSPAKREMSVRMLAGSQRVSFGAQSAALETAYKCLDDLLESERVGSSLSRLPPFALSVAR